MACLSFDGFVKRTGRSLKSVAEESMTPGARVPTLCEHGCEVEMLNPCCHGCASIVVELMRAGHKWNELPSQAESGHQTSRDLPSMSAPRSSF
jgi:hypothetical protein